MITERKLALKSILESNSGIHLTAYLVNRGDLVDLKSQLQTVLNESYEWLVGAMSSEERKKFLEPIDSLLSDGRILMQMKGNIGVYRSENYFRILNIPIEIEQSCQVASSFHVKPLLRWLQGDQEFIFLGVDNEEAHLYLGSQSTFKKIDSIFLEVGLDIGKDPIIGKNWNQTLQKKLLGTEMQFWLKDWIAELTKQSKPKLFIAGDPLVINETLKNIKYKKLVKTPLSKFFQSQNSMEYCKNIRQILKDDSMRVLENSLLEFRFAELGNRTTKNIFQISKAVVQGKVKKLIVTDELNIFGKLDPQTGGLAIHPFDLDHEDDCILDDLAQMVLSKGGEVVVAKRNEIPKGRPVLAILNDDPLSLEKTEEFQYEDLQERFK